MSIRWTSTKEVSSNRNRHLSNLQCHCKNHILNNVTTSEPTSSGLPILIKDKHNEEVESATLKKAQEDEDQRKKVKATVMKLFKQTKVGCNKDICFN